MTDKLVLTREDNWDRRRRNLAAIIAFKSTNAKEVSIAAGFSPNTVGKFTRGETRSLRWSTLEAVCEVLNIPIAALNRENPLSETKNRLTLLIENMPEEDAKALLEKLTNEELERRKQQQRVTS